MIWLDNQTPLCGVFCLPYCKNLKNIYYCGNKNDYKKINKGFNNDELEKAAIYYYSDTKPLEKGNSWRYFDGKIVVWEK